MLLFFISLYLLSNVAVGAWAARRVTTSQDFVLAGRRLPLLLAASVTFATWFGSETIMGAPAMFVEGDFWLLSKSRLVGFVPVSGRCLFCPSPLPAQHHYLLRLFSNPVWTVGRATIRHYGYTLLF